MKVTVFTDGGARGNPGPSGIGGVIKNQAGETIAEVSEYIGETTNNQAEYQAMVQTLAKAKELGATEVECFLDSLLVVNQVNGDWKVKKKELQPHVIAIHNLRIQIGKVTFAHVRREKNSEADALVNKAIDAYLEKNS